MVLLAGFTLGSNQDTKASGNIIDSLNSVIRAAGSDTAVSRAYVDLSEALFRLHPDTIVGLCNKALTIVEEGLVTASNEEAAVLLSTKAMALNNIGLTYYRQGELDTAYGYYQECLAIFEEQEEQSGIAMCYHNIGSIYKSRGDIKSALENYHKALYICQEVGNKQCITNAFNNIGLIYIDQGEYTIALDIYTKSIELQQEMGHTWGLINSFNNIGLVHGKLGEREKELEYYQKSLSLAEKSGYKQSIGRAYNNIGMVYKKQGERAKAIYYLEKSLEVLQDIEYLISRPRILRNIGSLYMDQGDLDKAEDYCKRSLELAQEKGYTEYIGNAAEILYMIAEQQGRYEQALEYHKLHVLMEDSLFNEENTKKLAQLQAEMEYENKLREQTLKLEKKQAVEEEKFKRYLYISMVISLLVLVVIGGIFWGLRQRLINEKLGAELSFLKSQINPHFLFNTLNNIYALVLKKSADAPNAVLMLSDIMRYMLHDSNHKRVLLETEIDYISNFIKLQKLRIGTDVNVDLAVHGVPNGLKIAPMLLIPFVENAFKHGELQQKDAYIKIQLNIGPAEIDFLVENLLRKKKEMTTSGIGLDNLKKRLALIYPGKYKLTSTRSAKTYVCNLKLQIL